MTALTDTPAVVEPTAPPTAPRRWLGPHGGWWLLLIGGVILAGYLIYDALVGGGIAYTRSIPTTSIVLGSFLAVVCVFYTMLYRLREGDGVTVARLFAALAVAGILTTFAAGQANAAIGRLGIGAQAHLGERSIGIASGLFAGPVEETLKGLTVLLVGLTLGTKTFRSGLFVGGAVGLGFAAFENLEYLADGWSHPILGIGQVGSLTALAVGRTVITPLLHPILTSLLGGALFATARDRRFGFSVPLVGTWFAVMGVHSLWDTLGIGVNVVRGTVPTVAYGGIALLVFVAMLGIAVGLPIVWRVVARHANRSAGVLPPKRAAPPPPPGYRLV